MSINRNNNNLSEQSPILLGSTFSMALIQREVHIVPSDIASLRSIIAQSGFASFWGHTNTLAAANELLGTDINPATLRPAVSVSPEGYPMLDDQVFTECWILTPSYEPGFRPAIGQEVQPEQITGWNVLQMKWIDQ